MGWFIEVLKVFKAKSNERNTLESLTLRGTVKEQTNRLVA